MLLRAAKAFGLFAFARYVTRRELRILCYHGLSVTDEHAWRPGLFMRQETLRGRLALLQRQGYPVISLSAAVDGLRRGVLPDNSVVITFDDGFYSVLSKGVPLFAEFRVPVTLYVTTYYVLHGSPIFRLAMQYATWKATSFGRTSSSQADVWAEIDRGEKLASEAERRLVAAKYLGSLGIDWDEIIRTRSLSLVTRDELGELVRCGVDVQLHTHRHRLPTKRDAVLSELEDNRNVLKDAVGTSLTHFCYPSGVWSSEHLPILAEAGVTSATTCDDGLNPQNSDLMTLRRFIDSDSKSLIEFEAETSGFKDLVRRTISCVRG